MRVAADQLAVEAGDHVRDGEVAGLARHLGIKEDLQQKVAQLLGEILPMPALNGVKDLVGLLKGIFSDSVEALLAIPRTAIGAAQAGHDAHGFGEKCSRIGGRIALRAHSNNVNDALEDCFSPVTVVWLALPLGEETSTPAMVACIFFGVCGLLVGSFLNVCILRLPAGESVVWPRSHCRLCNHSIASRDNIPVLSYLLLGAACRACGSRIAWRYPVIELATCALFVMCCVWISPGWPAGFWALLCFLLLG